MTHLNRFNVKWHTSPSPGATFYRGQIDVWAEDAEDAEMRAPEEVRRRMFQDYSSSNHIVVEKITHDNSP